MSFVWYSTVLKQNLEFHSAKLVLLGSIPDVFDDHLTSVLDFKRILYENKCRSSLKIQCSNDLENPDGCALVFIDVSRSSCTLSTTRSIFSNECRSSGLPLRATINHGHPPIAELLEVEEDIVPEIVVEIHVVLQ